MRAQGLRDGFAPSSGYFENLRCANGLIRCGFTASCANKKNVEDPGVISSKEITKSIDRQ
jgi:hypothetical protein